MPRGVEKSSDNKRVRDKDSIKKGVEWE